LNESSESRKKYQLNIETLKSVLSDMYNTAVEDADYQAVQLHGGDVGDVKLISGNAKTESGEIVAYKLVVKHQEKWERYGDVDSWRREYDLYTSKVSKFFTDNFCWPKCYHAEINDDYSQLWMEHIDGQSGQDMTVDDYILSSYELGCFQGKIYADKSDTLKSLANLSELDFVKTNYMRFRNWPEVYDYIRSDTCDLPKHLCQMIIKLDEEADEIWRRIQKLPVVFNHRDYWVANIFCDDKQVKLIDWDTSGWGYLGEDIASLIADESNIDIMAQCYHECISAYHKGLSEYMDLSMIDSSYIYDLILLIFGYRFIHWYKFAKTEAGRELQLKSLQIIYDLGLEKNSIK